LHIAPPSLPRGQLGTSNVLGNEGSRQLAGIIEWASSSSTAMEMDLDLPQLDATSKIEDLTSSRVNVNAPSKFLQVKIRALFAKRAGYNCIAAYALLSFLSTLHDVLSLAKPPSVGIFLSLTQHTTHA